MSAYGADGRRFESCTGCFLFSVHYFYIDDWLGNCCRHLQAMGFQKMIVVRLDEWRKLTPEERVPFLIQCESGSPTSPVMSVSDFDVNEYD